MLELQNRCANLLPVQVRRNLTLFPFESVTVKKKEREGRNTPDDQHAKWSRLLKSFLFLHHIYREH